MLRRDTTYLINNTLSMNMSPDKYRESRERMEILSSMIKDGERAKTIKLFVDEMLKEVETDTLQKLSSAQCDPAELRGYYRGALLFAQKVESAIQMGEKKRQKLAELKSEQEKKERDKR